MAEYRTPSCFYGTIFIFVSCACCVLTMYSDHHVVWNFNVILHGIFWWDFSLKRSVSSRGLFCHICIHHYVCVFVHCCLVISHHIKTHTVIQVLAILWASEDHVQRLNSIVWIDYRRLLHELLCILYSLIFVKLDICSKTSSCMDPCSVITQNRQPSYRLDSAICHWGSSILAKGQAALTEIHVNAGGVTSGHWPTVTPASYKCLSHACPFVALCWRKLEVFLKGRWIFFPPPQQRLLALLILSSVLSAIYFEGQAVT